MCAFTRHPTALAHAIGALHALDLTPSELLVMTTIAQHADRQGLYWGGTNEELQRLTALSHHTIRVIGRKGRKLGILDWIWIRPFERFPKRVSYSKPAVWGRGKKTSHGGRVWILRWEKLGVPFVSYVPGMNREGLISTDQPGLISSDQSSDPSPSSRELLRIPHSPAAGGARRPAVPAENTAAGARSARPPKRLEVRLPETGSPPATDGESRAASAARAPLSQTRENTQSERLEGEGGGPAGRRGTPDRPARLDEIQEYFREIDALFAAKAKSPPPR